MVAKALGLAFRRVARGHFEHPVENPLAHFGDRQPLVDDRAAVDVHVVRQAVVHFRIGRQLEAGRRFAAIDRAATGGEADHIGARGDLAGDRTGIITGAVHEHETLGVDRLAIAIDAAQIGGAALGKGAQRFFQNGGQAAGFVTGRGVVVHGAAIALGILLPPFDPLDQLFADLAADRAAGQQMLGAIDLRGFGENAGAAMADQQVDRRAQAGVGGHAGIGVRTAALQGQGDLARRAGFAHRGIGRRQHVLDKPGAPIDGFG